MDTINKLASDASNTIAAGANYVNETLQGKTSEAKAEANEQTLKSDQASLGDKVGAGLNYVQNSAEQAGHESKAEVHKQDAKH